MRCDRSDARGRAISLSRSVRTRGLTTSLLIGTVVCSVAACDGWGTGPGRAPRAVGQLPAITIIGTMGVAVAPLFRNPNGDSLTLTARSIPPDALRTSVSGSFVELDPARYTRRADVVVTATDPGGRRGDLSLRVFVEWLPIPVLPPPDPREPRIRASMPARQLLLGELTALALDHWFLAPATATFTVTSSSAAVDASFFGDSLVLAPRSLGPAEVTVTASNDVDGSLHSAQQIFDVVVHPPGTPPNNPPRALYTRARIIPVGFSVPYPISEYFLDREGRPLTFTATSDAPNQVAVSVSGRNVILQGKSPGEAVITLVATDHGGLPVRTPLRVFAVGLIR